ncbi:hypothetical protein LCGC14_2591730, partial [marine sediment metagenome]
MLTLHVTVGEAFEPDSLSKCWARTAALPGAYASRIDVKGKANRSLQDSVGFSPLFESFTTYVHAQCHYVVLEAKSTFKPHSIPEKNLSTEKTQAVDTFEEYKQIPGVNWSTLKSLRVSPKQYQHDIMSEREDAAHFRIGRAAHGFTLEPDTFEQRFVCYKDGPRRGKWWDKFQDDNPGKEILNATEWIKAIGTATAMVSHPIASEFLLKGLKEHVITWTDKKTGIDCKGRLDLVNGKLVDIKTTSSLIPRLFATQVARLAYHGQLAFYKDGLAANGI